MNRMIATHSVLISVLLGACSADPADQQAIPAAAAEARDKPSVEQVATDGTPAQTSPGKPSAPISIDYRVLGTPIVGQPVPIEIRVSSSITDRPIAVSYHINDSASMVFPASQALQVDVRMEADSRRAARQVTVVPQREGRLYLNVLAEIETDAGSMIKSMAVPISVGRALEEPEVNGELKTTAEGETVVSMPAKESN